MGETQAHENGGTTEPDAPQRGRFASCISPDWRRRRDSIRDATLAKGLPWPGMLRPGMDEMSTLEPRPGSMMLLAAREARRFRAMGRRTEADVIIAAAVELLDPWHAPVCEVTNG